MTKEVTMKSIWENLKSLIQRKEGKKQSTIINVSWENIPDDILELILKRLCLTDYLRTSAVCSSWRATVSKAIANKYCPPAPELPLLLLQTKLNISFFNLTTEQVFGSKEPPFEADKICHGSIEGWLIMSETSHHPNCRAIFFFNLVTNTRVMVPSPLNFPTNSPIKCPNLTKMVASSKPNDPNCLVVGLFSDHSHLSFTRLSDKSWTMIEADKNDEGINFMEMEILNGKLYVLTDKDLHSMLVFDLQEPSSDPPKPKLLVKLPQIRPEPTLTTIGNHRKIFNALTTYIAIDAASGELLLIYKFQNIVYEPERVGYMNIIKEFISPPRATKFQVFKLDMNSESPWAKVDSLGNRLLLANGSKCLVISKTALDVPEELIRGNCIYFASLYRCPADTWMGIQMGKFCLTDGSIKNFSLEKSSFATVPHPYWFIPNVW